MLYVHSFSSIEQTIAYKLSLNQHIIEFDAKSIHSKHSLSTLSIDENHKTLVYSFQQMEHYKNLNTFQDECRAVDNLVEYCIENGFARLIVLTYPGAYFNSSNLFLMHKGQIEQKFVNSGISCVLLNVQGICDVSNVENNLHNLFYDHAEKKCVIPQKKNTILFSIKLNNLVDILLEASQNRCTGKFDVFDTVQELNSFLINHSSIDSVLRLAPLYLYFKSYIGKYASATMLELFLQAQVPMYNFRTEKEFCIQLQTERMHENSVVETYESISRKEKNAIITGLLYNA